MNKVSLATCRSPIASGRPCGKPSWYRLLRYDGSTVDVCGNHRLQLLVSGQVLDVAGLSAQEGPFFTVIHYIDDRLQHCTHRHESDSLARLCAEGKSEPAFIVQYQPDSNPQWTLIHQFAVRARRILTPDVVMTTHAGAIDCRMQLTNGRLYTLYNAKAADLDESDGRWATVCEDHSTICSHQTLTLARRAMTNGPASWCDECRGGEL